MMFISDLRQVCVFVDTPVSSSDITDHHEIPNILLKEALNTITITCYPFIYFSFTRAFVLSITNLCHNSFVAPRLKSSLQTFYVCHHELVDNDEFISISQMTNDLLLSMQFLFPISPTGPLTNINMCNTTAV